MFLFFLVSGVLHSFGNTLLNSIFFDNVLIIFQCIFCFLQSALHNLYNINHDKVDLNHLHLTTVNHISYEQHRFVQSAAQHDTNWKPFLLLLDCCFRCYFPFFFHVYTEATNRHNTTIREWYRERVIGSGWKFYEFLIKKTVVLSVWIRAKYVKQFQRYGLLNEIASLVSPENGKKIHFHHAWQTEKFICFS